MPITADDIKEQILLETGDVDPATGDSPAVAEDGLIYNRLDTLWEMYAAKDRIAPGLRKLYVKRDALRMVLAALAQLRFDVSDVLAGLTMKAGQVWSHFWDLHECCKGEIQAAEKQARVSGGYRGGRLATKAPITPVHPPDGNARRYGGDLYRGREVVE